MIPKIGWEAIRFGFSIGVIIFAFLLAVKEIILFLGWMYASALFLAVAGGVAAGVEYFCNPPKQKKGNKCHDH